MQKINFYRRDYIYIGSIIGMGVGVLEAIFMYFTFTYFVPCFFLPGIVLLELMSKFIPRPISEFLYTVIPVFIQPIIIDTCVGTIIGYLIWYIRKSKVIREGYCMKCGYNLTGNVSGTCPECGTEI